MAEGTVFVVDDDQAVRKSLDMLFASVGMAVQTFANAREFLGGYRAEQAGCLVLDVRMRGMSGLELQRRLRESAVHIPIIIITGHGDVPTAVRAMKDGALEFLEKPFSTQLLLEHVQEALRCDAIRQAQWELRTGRRFDPAAVRSGHPASGPQPGGQSLDDDMTASPPLTDAELADRRAFLDRQVNATLWLRALRYLLACPFCQTFWSATFCVVAASLVGPVTASPWLDWLPTCLAYAAAAAWVLDRNAPPIHAMTADAGGSLRPLSTEAGRACAGCATR